MGYTQMDQEAVKSLVKRIMGEWVGSDYDLLRHNCCSFCDDFCQRLGVGKIPDWVNNLAAAGATIQDGFVGAVLAGQAARIIACAKAGEFDARYNIRGTARAKAQDVLFAFQHVDRSYRIKETATDVAAHAAVGAARAAHEIMTSAQGAHAQDKSRVSLRPVTLEQDPFLLASDLEQLKAPQWRGGAASAASDVNKVLGSWLSKLGLVHCTRHCS
mmetsp:Transcript_22957/g.34504  ORF Transcript_22957/g.34504 Transcript_22957/m.34504 type:complete len:215 (+) Transcript_22957:1-645(+)